MAQNPYELVVRKCKEYEARLAKQHGARGAGLGEKLRDVADQLDPRVVRRLRRIIACRNQLVHELGASRSLDFRAFARDCVAVDQHWAGRDLARTTARLTRAIEREERA